MKKIISILVLIAVTFSIVLASYSEDTDVTLNYNYDEITLPSGVEVNLGLVATNADGEVEMKLKWETGSFGDDDFLTVGDHTLVVRVKPNKRWIVLKEITVHVVDRNATPEVTRNENDILFK